MAEMKGNWLKLPGYRKINALVHKYPGSFTKRMFPDVLSLKRSYQSWVDSGEGLKGTDLVAFLTSGQGVWKGSSQRS